MPANCDSGVASDVTVGHLLNGRVSYAQPRHGFRSGLEPVLLAAAVPARAGQRVLEAGTGAGAGLLCLAARVPGVIGVGVERDPALADLARCNAAANGWDKLTFVAAALEEPGDLGVFDHAMANPPYHAPDGTRSPVPARESAKRRHESLITDWAVGLALRLRHRGTLSLILPAEALPLGLAGLQAAGCRPHALLPLWPKAGRPARLLLMQGIRDGRAPMRLLAGLLLHGADGRFTKAADDVLRHAAALQLD